MNRELIPEGSTIIVGLSGGPDSVYLLDQLVQLKKDGTITEIIAVHLDHEWRSDSGKDSEFCAAVAQRYGVPFISKKMSELTGLDLRGSKEEIGRNARRHLLESIMRDYDADAIALGHHAQDQQETFFIRLLRGASLPGLTGMQEKSGLYIRPLLALSKEKILAYLDSNKIQYLTDPSNESDQFLRNRIRNQLMPLLQKIDNRFDANLLQTISRLQQTEQYLQSHTQELFAQASRRQDGARTIDTKQLLSHHPVMQQRLIMEWLKAEQVPFVPTQAFLHEIVRFLQQPESKSHHIHEKWAIKKVKNHASIHFTSPRLRKTLSTNGV